jgi:hypothetical protein
VSWDISLRSAEEDGLDCLLDMGDDPPFEDGETYPIGGTTECELSVTYNYGHLFDFSQLKGMSGEQSAALLRGAVEKFGTRRWQDYWAPTHGNVGAACARLLSFAERHPAGIWSVS